MSNENQSQLEQPENSESVNSYPFKNTAFFDIEHIKFLFLSSQGRINRKRYWLGVFTLSIPNWILIILGYAILGEEAGLVFHMLTSFLLMIPFIFLWIKRCHDRNRSGHFIWVMLVPIVQLWPTIEIPFLKGTVGPNRFGPDPLS